MKTWGWIFFSLYSGLFFHGCTVRYSMSGASVSPDVKTVTVKTFPNNATLIQPSLSQVLTEKLKDRILTGTALSFAVRDGDLLFDGAIMDYHTTPVAIGADERASLNRLTVIISVKFVNSKDEKQNFETTFSRYADYDSKLMLSAVERTLMEQICDQLVEDIFNKSLTNW